MNALYFVYLLMVTGTFLALLCTFPGYDDHDDYDDWEDDTQYPANLWLLVTQLATLALSSPSSLRYLCRQIGVQKPNGEPIKHKDMLHLINFFFAVIVEGVTMVSLLAVWTDVLDDDATETMVFVYYLAVCAVQICLCFLCMNDELGRFYPPELAIDEETPTPETLTPTDPIQDHTAGYQQPVIE